DADEAETDPRYSGESLNGESPNGESRDHEAYDRDVDDVGGAEGSRSDGTTSYRGPDEAQARPDEPTDETEQELARRDQTRYEVDRPDPHRTDLDRSDRNRSGYDAGASQDPAVSQPDGGSVSVVDDPDVLMRRWQEVQTGFVDDPRQAVQEADGLVQQ